MRKTIYKEIFCEGQPESVWQSLTNPEEISAWLMQTSDFRAEVGAKFTMQAKPMGKWDGVIYGEVLVAEKFSVLSYTWKGSQMKSTTILKWTLIPESDGTRLKMEHSGFSGLGDYVLGIFHAMGWNRFLKQLNNLIRKNGKK